MKQHRLFPLVFFIFLAKFTVLCIQECVDRYLEDGAVQIFDVLYKVNGAQWKPFGLVTVPQVESSLEENVMFDVPVNISLTEECKSASAETFGFCCIDAVAKQSEDIVEFRLSTPESHEYFLETVIKKKVLESPKSKILKIHVTAKGIPVSFYLENDEWEFGDPISAIISKPKFKKEIKIETKFHDSKPPVQKSFLAKYWWIILVLVLVLSPFRDLEPQQQQPASGRQTASRQ